MLSRFASDDVLSPVEGYDVIGDVHGCAATLKRLLQRLGYSRHAGVYRHRRRRAIFVGDIIDRGPRIREALLLVRDMVDAGSAHMVMGNHEFNAITYCTPHHEMPPGCCDYLRPHTSGNTRQIAETLEQFANHPYEWHDMLQWFRRLPLYLELGNHRSNNCFRVVHACWDHQLINQHQHRFPDGGFDEQFIRESVVAGSLASVTVQVLTRGVDLPLPVGVKVVSKDGYIRSSFRTKFWAVSAETYGELLFQPDPIPAEIAALPISHGHRAQMVRYGVEEPPLFVGHYWLKGQPKPIASNIACLDYSAVKYGRLVAYRMDGEQQLQAEKFVWEYVDP
jgi:hypothetical protein